MKYNNFIREWDSYLAQNKNIHEVAYRYIKTHLNDMRIYVEAGVEPSPIADEHMAEKLGVNLYSMLSVVSRCVPKEFKKNITNLINEDIKIKDYE